MDAWSLARRDAADATRVTDWLDSEIEHRGQQRPCERASWVMRVCEAMLADLFVRGGLAEQCAGGCGHAMREAREHGSVGEVMEDSSAAATADAAADAALLRCSVATSQRQALCSSRTVIDGVTMACWRSVAEVAMTDNVISARRQCGSRSIFHTVRTVVCAAESTDAQLRNCEIFGGFHRCYSFMLFNHSMWRPLR